MKSGDFRKLQNRERGIYRTPSTINNSGEIQEATKGWTCSLRMEDQDISPWGTVHLEKLNASCFPTVCCMDLV
jgi:hypothetical protein